MPLTLDSLNTIKTSIKNTLRTANAAHTGVRLDPLGRKVLNDKIKALQNLEAAIVLAENEYTANQPAHKIKDILMELEVSEAQNNIQVPRGALISHALLDLINRRIEPDLKKERVQSLSPKSSSPTSSSSGPPTRPPPRPPTRPPPRPPTRPPPKRPVEKKEAKLTAVDHKKLHFKVAKVSEDLTKIRSKLEELAEPKKSVVGLIKVEILSLTKTIDEVTVNKIIGLKSLIDAISSTAVTNDKFGIDEAIKTTRFDSVQGPKQSCSVQLSSQLQGKIVGVLNRTPVSAHESHNLPKQKE